MSANGAHRVMVCFHGMKAERADMSDLELTVVGRRPITLPADTRRHELSLPAGFYHLQLRFTLGGKTFTRSLAALRVPPAARARFDLGQAVADGLAEAGETHECHH